MVFVVVTGKSGVEYAVGLAVVGNHDVLISTVSTDREATSVIGVHISDVYFSKMNLFG